MTPKQQINHIVKWIRSYARKNKIDTLVVGVSGGIDSAVVWCLDLRTQIREHNRELFREWSQHMSSGRLLQRMIDLTNQFHN